MRIVYLIRSLSSPHRSYVGITSEIERRLEEHNSGKSLHTAKYRPWQLAAAIRFEDDGRAFEFERYMKTASGRAFSNRHFW